MTDRAAVVAGLAEFARRPATAHECRADPGETFSAPAFERLREHLRTLERLDQLNELLAAVAPLVAADGTDPFRACALAVQCGTLVEWGGDEALLAPHLFAALPRLLGHARRADGTAFDADPDAHRARAGLTFLMLATMAVLCRGAAYRQAARALPELVAAVGALADAHRETDFVRQVLGFTDGLEVLVLVPAEGKGVRVRLEAVATCAHLFTLLQAELIGGGHLSGAAPDPEVLAVARGEVPHTRRLYDSARFHFTTWGGLDPDGTLGVRVNTWVPVDAPPGAIPRFDGEPVLLVGPPVLGSRQWDSGFFANIHDALRSRVEVVDVLSGAAAREWLDRIRAAR